MFYKKTLKHIREKANYLERRIYEMEMQNETIVQVIGDEKKETNEKIEMTQKMITRHDKVIQLLSKAIEEDRNKITQVIEVIKYICAKQGIMLKKEDVKNDKTKRKTTKNNTKKN